MTPPAAGVRFSTCRALYYHPGPGIAAELRRALVVTAGEMVIQIGIGEHGDAERLAEATYLLQGELGGLDIEAVHRPPAERPPAGAKGVDVGAIGTLVVTLGHHAQLGAVVNALLDWALRDRHRRVRVELDGDVLEVDGLTARDQRRIVDHWLRRHPGR